MEYDNYNTKTEELNMVSEEDLKKDTMYFEAVDRLELMKANPQDRWLILMNRELEFKIVVNHEERSVRRNELTEDELQMIKKFESEYKVICYYLIQDEGIWSDGCTFPRYTLLYVGENTDEYEKIREECIKHCGIVPAYVVNMEDLDCSEFGEIKFENVAGNLINVS